MFINLAIPIKECPREVDNYGREKGRRRLTQPVKALHRPGAALAALFVAVPLILAATANPAQAQVDEIVDTGEETTGVVTDVVEDVADPVQDVVEGPVQETIDETTKAVDEATGGATEPVTDAVRETSRETLAPVDEVLGGATDEAVQGGGEIAPGSTTGSLENAGTTRQVANSNRRPVRQGNVGSVDDGTTAGAPEELLPTQPNVDAQRSGSIVEQAQQIAREVAFPMFLLLMVGAFLAIQSRWDKRDPKLALAPLDLDDQYLSFR